MAVFPGFGLSTLPTCCRYNPSDFVGLRRIAADTSGTSVPSDMTSTDVRICIFPFHRQINLGFLYNS